MDLFSHALLPYLIGNFFKRKKDEITALVLGGIAPDFDISILWINYIYPNFFLLVHRGITHSLVFGFFTGITVLYLACRGSVKNRVLRYTDYEPQFSSRTIAFAFSGVLIHLFLDYVTTQGIPLLYPLDTARYAAEVFFYTDIYLTVVSLIIVIFLFKKPLQKNTMKFLLVFLVVFATMGALRIAEKTSAEQFFQSEKTPYLNTGIKAYPTMNPFDWYALAEDRTDLSIFEYDGINRASPYNETVSRLSILSQGNGLDEAVSAAGELPQVKMFKWRAYAVAVNASFSDDAWYLEYYDPMRRAMFRDSPAIFRRINAPLKVKVEAESAVVI
jgi:inner membrane protein